MTHANALPHLPQTGACALPHLGVIRAVGADAASFLHNQLTQDFVLIKEGQARHTCVCGMDTTIKQDLATSKFQENA